MSNDKTESEDYREFAISAPTPQDRYYTIWADIGELILFCLTSVAARAIGKRLETLSRAAYIPDSGSGNIAANAFLLNMSEGGFYQSAHRRHVPKTKPGDECIYRFADVTKSFDPPTSDAQPGEELRPRCAGKTKGTSASKKPRQK